MKTCFRQIVLIVSLIALLPVGVIVTVFVDSAMKHRYDNNGTGFFYGHIFGRVHGQESYFFLELKGETQPRWYWAQPENYHYQSLELEWDAGSLKAQGVLDLRTFVLTTKDDSFTLSEATIADMIRSKSSHDGIHIQAEAAELYSLLRAAAEGTLPPPRHHWYHFNQALGGTLAHFSLGMIVPYAIYGWCFIWIAIVATYLIKHRKSKVLQANQCM